MWLLVFQWRREGKAKELAVDPVMALFDEIKNAPYLQDPVKRKQ